ncbi:DUF488 domain-containing protein [Paracoccus sp. CPCC 101403]|uniref:DUF488 domain-containing protein n=1 Tax=Paracoccus broussonetiae TaxID=3075834 RepID=A0ABU3ECC3_9RHOB|nr:DUF488 domain-containing protein [Paracoccus sp. CPCC 101403]MDT1061872.1 DUF488 domain-containing protein [Paracoccus sp. CPCC 101403]
MNHHWRNDLGTTIHTVGYEKTDVHAYVECLKDASVQVLVDVRERPISRKKGFSKRALAEAVEAAGIRYIHVQALGDPKPGRDAARAGEHDRFVEIFSGHMKSEQAQEALASLAEDIGGLRICLTCFERDHTCCHRTIVAEQLAALTNGKIEHLKVSV